MSKREATAPGWNDGATAVEAALTLSVLLLLILGIIEFAVGFWQWNTMLLATQEVGRYVMINNTTCNTSCAQTQLQAILTSASSSCANPASPAAGQMCVNATTGTVNSTPSMTLTASYGFSLIALAGPFTITSGIRVPLD